MERARAKWQQHIEAWLASGLRQVDYCRQQGIEPKYLRVWRRKLALLGAVPPAKRRSPRSSAPTPAMIPVIVKPDSAAPAARRSPSLSQFLTSVCRLPAQHSRDGALIYMRIDWHHAGELLAAGKAVFTEHKNICVWAKD